MGREAGLELAFIRAVVEHPHDDGPRLIYADWLDENAGTVKCPTCTGEGEVLARLWRSRIGPGEPSVWEECTTCRGTGRVPDGRADRAELIRVQVDLEPLREEGCELVTRQKQQHEEIARQLSLEEGMAAQMQFRACREALSLSSEPWWCDYCKLSRRERELLYHPDGSSTWTPIAQEIISTVFPDAFLRHSAFDLDKLNGEAPYIFCGCGIRFRRGFISEVRCLWLRWCAVQECLLSLHPVEEVTLTTAPCLDLANPRKADDGREVLGDLVLSRSLEMPLPAGGYHDIILDLLGGRWPQINWHFAGREVE